MLDEMRLRNLSAETQRNYIQHIADFALRYNISPDRLGLDEVRNHRLYLFDEKLIAPQSVNGFVAAVKFLYTQVLDMPWSNERLPMPTSPSNRRSPPPLKRSTNSSPPSDWPCTSPFSCSATARGCALPKQWQSRRHRQQTDADPRSTRQRRLGVE